MTKFLLSLLAAACTALVVHAADDTNAQTDARVNALDIAGAFSNDGYKIRDGHWAGTLASKDKAQVMLVNLYAGNQYYFSLGTEKPATVALAVYDERAKKSAAILSRWR